MEFVWSDKSDPEAGLIETSLDKMNRKSGQYNRDVVGLS